MEEEWVGECEQEGRVTGRSEGKLRLGYKLNKFYLKKHAVWRI